MPGYFIPQRKNTGSAIMAAGAAVGKTITDLPGKIRQKKKEDAQQEQLTIAYDALKKTSVRLMGLALHSKNS